MPQTESQPLETKIKNLLADYLGLEPNDILEDDMLANELFMKPTDIADFLHRLEAEGIDTSSIDLGALETVEDLIDAIKSDHYL